MKPGLATAVFCCFTVAAVGCDDSRLNQGRPRIVVDPEAVVFDTINAGEQAQATIRVSNTGQALLRIDSIDIVGEQAGSFAIVSWGGSDWQEIELPLGLSPPGTLGENSSADLVVAFSASELGQYEATLVIESNDELNPRLEVPLEGACAVPDIEVTPRQLDFGQLRLYASASLMLEVANTGQADLLVAADGIALESGATDSPFKWVAEDMRIPGGQGRQIQVTYTPVSVELDPVTHQPLAHTDALLISSNDPDENPVRVPLSGRVKDNLPPLLTLRVTETLKLDGTPLADPCEIATSDTTRIEATVVDPEGEPLGPTNVSWSLQEAPVGSKRTPSPVPGEMAATFRPDMYGHYVICAVASDPQGNESEADPQAACTCEQAAAQGPNDFDCQCIQFTAFPREDIRIELVWDMIGPDLDLHLLAPPAVQSQYCERTLDCRTDPRPQPDPDWDRFACVDTGSTQTCRTPNCDPQSAGCLDGQWCYDPDDTGPEPAGCHWSRCSSRDCYWDSRNPDWGTLGDDGDNPLLAIDCTKGCRAENINLNRPEQGTYMVKVNVYEALGPTQATVRIFFKGDLVPSYEWTNTLTNTCDTWNVATIEWVDPENHPVTYLDGSISTQCCQ